MHDKGWIHCDVKPDNFLADEQANVKLIDFSIGVRDKKKGGISSLFGGNRPKSIRGTRSYMAPEQIRRKHADARSDIYGLGCVIYELLSGKTPYSANTPDELLQKHLGAPIPNLESCSLASKPFSEMVRKMLAKKPDQRIQSMDDFLHIYESTQMFRPGKRPPGFTR